MDPRDAGVEASRRAAVQLVSEQAEEIARLRAEAELVPAVLAEKYQEGREDGITWAQRANDGYAQAAVAAERERIAELADNWPSECLASGGEECCGPGLAAALRREEPPAR